MLESGIWRRVAGHLAIVLAYGLVGVVLTYPLLWVGTEAIVGNRIAAKDGWQTVWDIWWWREGLAHQPQAPLLTHYIYWPTGVDLLAYRAYGLTSMFQATPLLLLGYGPLVAYTWNMLLNFALSGYALFLLARRLTGTFWPALAAGLIYTASPFHLSRFADGYHDLSALQWLPLYLLALALWLERGSWGWGLAALLTLIAQLLASSYYTQFALVWTAVAALSWTLRAARQQGWRVRAAALPLLRAAGLLGLWGLLCLPLLRRLGGAAIGYSDYLLRQELHALDLLDLVLPSAIHPLWSMFDPHRLTHPYGSWNVVPGVATLVLGCWGLWRERGRLWPWALGAAAMALFALGPTLFVAGQPLPVPMPHDLLNLFAAGRASQRPNHFLVLTIVVLAVGVAALLARLRPRAALLATLAVLAVDCLPPLPWPILPPPPPSWQQALATLPSGAVIELPYRPREIDYQVSQLRHGRPIVGGYVSRVPPYPLNNHTALRRLSGTDHATIARGDSPQATAAFAAALCARALVIHPALTTRSAAEHKARIAALLPDARLLHDGEALLYALPAEPAPAPLLVLDDGWYDLEYDGTRRWQWSAPTATMQLINPSKEPMLAQLDITAYTATATQQASMTLDGVPLWRGSFGPQPSRRSLTLRLPPQGSVVLSLASQGPRQGRNLGLAVSDLNVRVLPGQQLSCPATSPLTPGLP